MHLPGSFRKSFPDWFLEKAGLLASIPSLVPDLILQVGLLFVDLFISTEWAAHSPGSGWVESRQ